MQKLKADEGFVQALQAQVKEAAEALVSSRRQVAAQAGLPWGAEKIGDDEALQRMDAFEDPQRAEELARYSDGQLAQLAVQAAKLRAKAWQEGRWNPVHAKEAAGQPVPPTFRPEINDVMAAMAAQNPEIARLFEQYAGSAGLTPKGPQANAMAPSANLQGQAATTPQQAPSAAPVSQLGPSAAMGAVMPAGGPAALPPGQPAV